MPKLAKFMESLTQEQDKQVMMGTIKPSNLPRSGCQRFQGGFKGNKKAKKPLEQKRDKNKSQEDPQGSKKNFQKKKNKEEMSKCYGKKFLWLWDQNRQLDSRNQSFPICNRNKQYNTKGSNLVPYSGRLKVDPH